jgi:dolichol-phosphate mannosyltransferase
VPSGVLIILPVLNEAGNIGLLLARIGQELAGIPHAVCVIDDGSVDGTIEKVIAAQPAPGGTLYLIRRMKRHRGSQRGSALKCGLEWGLQDPTFDVFVEIDGDLSHRTEELKAGIDLIESGRAHVALASKYLPGSQVFGRTLARRAVSRVCSLATSVLINPVIKDYSNGYRFYSRRAALLIAECRIRYGSPIYLSEVLGLWLREGLTVIEFPSTYIGRNEGISKLRIVDLVKAAIAVFEIAVRYHLTGFKKHSRQSSLQTARSCAEEASLPAVPLEKE